MTALTLTSWSASSISPPEAPPGRENMHLFRIELHPGQPRFVTLLHFDLFKISCTNLNSNFIFGFLEEQWSGMKDVTASSIDSTNVRSFRKWFPKAIQILHATLLVMWCRFYGKTSWKEFSRCQTRFTQKYSSHKGGFQSRLCLLRAQKEVEDDSKSSMCAPERT